VCEHVFVTEEANILHADLDAFYASVEQRDDPRLRGRPVIVGGGVVLAASYEAKARGVRTAMSSRQAHQLCPAAIEVPPRMSAYSRASRAVFEVFRQTTPLVEGISIDEAFLDVGGLRRIAGPPSQIAAQLRRAVREQVGLPITVGVARTKFLAKVASQVAKPDGLLVVPPDAELEFLHPLPIERLWGVGPVTARKLRERRIVTVGQVANLGEPTLVSLLGAAAGRHLHALAHNRDPRRVRVGQRRSSIGAQRALGRSPPPILRWRPPRWSTGSPDGCGRPGGWAARSCSGCGSVTSAGPPVPARCRWRPRRPRPCSPPSEACWPPRCR
jgi:DNA polymerase-4